MIFHPLVLIAASVLALTTAWAVWYGRAVERRQPPAGEFVASPFGRQHFIRLGKPASTGLRPVVLIHGSTTNALDMMLDLGPRLARSREVLIIDRLGHGFSDRPSNGWRLDVQAKAIRHVVRHVGFDRPIILGQSFGGAIALRYALEFGREISGLTLIAPVTHRWPGGVAWYNRIAINPLYGWLFRHSFIALYGRLGSPRGVARALQGSVHQSSYHERTRVALTFRPRQFRYNAEDIVRLYEQLVAMDGRYREITTPTEIVAGTHDMSVITTVHARSLERQMPGAVLRVIDHGGHALHHTHPEETLAALVRLDERLASEARSPLQGALRRLSQVFPGGAS